MSLATPGGYPAALAKDISDTYLAGSHSCFSKYW